MAQKVIIPVLIAFAITALLGPVVIPILRRLKVGQTEREELKSHLKKAGTPTMGGLMILAGIIVTSLIYMKDYPGVLPILFVTVGFGIIGFLDDYLKVVLRRSDGLLPWQKMTGQIVVTGVFIFYMARYTEGASKMLMPFTGGFETGIYLDLGWLAAPVMFLAILGTVNGANFTDGLDGLASSVTVLIATFFSAVAVGTGSGIEPVRSCRGAAGIPFVQCIPCQRVYGRYWLFGFGRVCGFHCLCPPYADLYPDCGVGLLDRASVCYDTGNLF